jgi:hypothetical protein
MKTSVRNALLIVATAGVGFLAGCGGVGGTYQVEGGGYRIEFQSGGKAVESLGPQKDQCTYVEDSKSVTLTCPDGKIVFTINDKGQLVAPPDSMLSAMGPLSKK